MSVLGGVIRMVCGMRPIMSCFTRNCGCSHGGQDTWDVRSWLGNPDGLCDENFLCLVSQETVVAAMTVIFFLPDKRRI